MEELFKIQQELHVPKENVGGGKGNYTYRTADEIEKKLKPLKEKYHVIITLDDEIQCIGNKNYLVSYATITNKAGETVTKRGWAREPETLAAMSLPQITGSLSSYARKAALCGLFLIDATPASQEVDALPSEPEHKEPEHKEEVATTLEGVIAVLKTSTSRADFDKKQRLHRLWLTNPQVVAVCTEIAKKYPRPVN